jgi:3-hydroxybutyryl-CoA dehydrogenase
MVFEKEHHSYIYNTLFNALNGAALTLVANKIVSFRDVDRCWMSIMQAKAGPYGIMDSIGLDTVYSIIKYWADATGDSQIKINAEFLEPYLRNGMLGQKTQKGFYSYPKPEYADENFIKNG